MCLNTIQFTRITRKTLSPQNPGMLNKQAKTQFVGDNKELITYLNEYGARWYKCTITKWISTFKLV